MMYYNRISFIGHDDNNRAYIFYILYLLMPIRSDDEIRFANLECTGIHEILFVYEVYVS